jgi:hypothetical protein
MKQRFIDFITRIKDWAGENPALAGAILAGLLMIGYLIYKKLFKREEVSAVTWEPGASGFMDYPVTPVTGGTDAGSGGSDPTDQLNFFMDYLEAESAMMDQFQRNIMDIVGQQRDDYSANLDRYYKDMDAYMRAMAAMTNQEQMVNPTIMQPQAQQTGVSIDIPPMIYQIWKTDEALQNVYMGSPDGLYKVFGDADTVQYFKDNPSSSVNVGSNVMDFRDSYNDPATAAARQTYADIVRSITGKVGDLQTIFHGMTPSEVTKVNQEATAIYQGSSSGSSSSKSSSGSSSSSKSSSGSTSSSKSSSGSTSSSKSSSGSTSSSKSSSGSTSSGSTVVSNPVGKGGTWKYSPGSGGWVKVG